MRITERYTAGEICSVGAITAGLCVFAMKSGGDDKATQLLGIALVFANLSLDGWTNATQDTINKQHQPSPHDMMVALNLWSVGMKDEILRHKGSIQAIPTIPEHLREKYKTTWEIKQKRVLELAADRGAYIDQSQSLNIHMVDANPAKVTSMHFAGWRLGLKTGMYYLRTKAAADAIQFTVEQKKAEDQTVSGLQQRAEEVDSMDAIACSLDAPDDCLMCGS